MLLLEYVSFIGWSWLSALSQNFVSSLVLSIVLEFTDDGIVSDFRKNCVCPCQMFFDLNSKVYDHRQDLQLETTELNFNVRV